MGIKALDPFLLRYIENPHSYLSDLNFLALKSTFDFKLGNSIQMEDYKH